MKKRFALLAAILSAVLLIACGSGAPTDTTTYEEATTSETAAVEPASEETTDVTEPEDPSAEILPLEIVESGYTIQPKSDQTIETYAYYGFQLHNPNTATGAYLPKVRITGRDAEGKVLGTDEQALMYVGPNETAAFGSVLSYGDSVPASIEFEIVSAETVDGSQMQYASPSELDITGTSEQKDTFSTKVVGEITNNSDTAQSMTAVTVLLRKEGKIVYGMTTYVNDLAPGTTVPFEAACFGTVPDHDSYEVHAQGWL